MKIYRLRTDVNKFQSFFLEKEDALSLDELSFNGSHRLETWNDPGFYVMHPKLIKGNFLGFGDASGALTVDTKALQVLEDLFEMSGELLPFTYKGAAFQVVNVTNVIDVLDEERTQWFYEKGSSPVERYVFHENRLTETPLFKIPQENSLDIFAVEGIKDPEDEFKGRVEQSGLTGLTFEEVWSRDD